MKKIFYLLTILLVFMGCTPSYTSSSEVASIEHVNYIHLKELGSMTVFTIEYDGHTYIVFDGYETRAVEHSPDCQCQQ